MSKTKPEAGIKILPGKPKTMTPMTGDEIAVEVGHLYRKVAEGTAT